MEIRVIEEHFTPVGSGWRSKAGETGKIHLSDIAKYVEWKMKLGAPIKAVDWELVIAAEVGFLWEDVLSYAYGARYAVRLGEIERDGIIMSPDGVSGFDPLEIETAVNEEYKATWKSVNNKPEDNFYWMTQFKSYCYGLGVTVTVLRALYINGNYKGSGPIYRVYRLEYTEEELVENWAMMVRHRDEMLEKGFMDIKQAKGEK